MLEAIVSPGNAPVPMATFICPSEETKVLEALDHLCFKSVKIRAGKKKDKMLSIMVKVIDKKALRMSQLFVEFGILMKARACDFISCSLIAFSRLRSGR
jgi:hypothetical protein